MDKPWKVIVAFAGVFLAGAIFGGAVGHRWISAKFRHDDRPPLRLQMLERLAQRLELTEAQKARIAPIVKRMEDETQRMRREGAQSFRAAMDRMNAEIAAELTPEQRVKMEEMRIRWRERVEKFRGEGRDRERPMPPPDGERP